VGIITAYADPASIHKAGTKYFRVKCQPFQGGVFDKLLFKIQ